MKTEISDFCKEYARSLIPAGEAIDVVVRAIRSEAEGGILQDALAGFDDIKHRLRTLIDKVEGQQAYLLIFGPLKSGKSTLMNAISATYVSEVTSLPAYPCLVYVRHGDKESIKLTRYNGRETVTESSQVMEVLIRDSHSSLADRIRKAEQDSRDFDPHQDYPEAIRRVDFEFKADNLAESGTVLVDTPGLYSRMKFGYDLMTKEFRNSASCAVFVVKPDNLFFEEVFREFEELLGFFSRVFLVVNYDSSKRDLASDGSLVPSVESREPGEVISKFQTLSMSAALKKAFEEGRLRIYPIDLLNAASRRLKGLEAAPAPGAGSGEEPGAASDGAAAPAAEREEAPGERSGKEEAGKPAPSADFQLFLDDLTEYLNSSDYLFELMVDSFRQGDVLRQEMIRLISEESLSGFIRHRNRLQDEYEEAKAQHEAAVKLSSFEWSKVFDGARQAIRQDLDRFSQKARQEMEQEMLTSINNWFESEDSLDTLVNQTWRKRLDGLQERIRHQVACTFRQHLDNSSGGAGTIPELVLALDRLRLDLREVYDQSSDVLRRDPEIGDCRLELAAEDLPITRSFWDKLLLRSQAKIRRKLLGDPDDCTNPVAPHKKRKRLIPSGRESMESRLQGHLDRLLPGSVRQASDQFLQEYVRRFVSSINKILKEKAASVESLQQRISRGIEAGKRIERTFQQLRSSIGSLAGDMDGLRRKFLIPARRLRGFQEVGARQGPFTLWTLPYSRGGALPAAPPPPAPAVAPPAEDPGNASAGEAFQAAPVDVPEDSAALEPETAEPPSVPSAGTEESDAPGQDQPEVPADGSPGSAQGSRTEPVRVEVAS